MKISEHANYLLNEYGRLQFDYAAYCKPDGESLRNEARNNLEEYIAELEQDKKALRGIEENLREHIDIGTLQLSVATARIAELGLELGRKSVELGELVGRNIIWEVINDELKSRRENLERENDCLQEKVSDLLKRIAELEAERRWIPVSERLPENRATVLAAFENREILTATYYKHHEGFGGVENYWHIEGWHSGNVTHWMPLPPNPESSNDTQTQAFVYGKESEEWN